jgi:hypothetical protein
MLSASDAVDGSSTGTEVPWMWVLLRPYDSEEPNCNRSPPAQAPLRFAILPELPPCLLGIEACASSHHWSRALQALGHTVRLIRPPM